MFLQSQSWQEFQEKYGRQCFRLADVLAIKFPLPFGYSWLYIPYGEMQNAKCKMQNFLELAKKEKAIFVKIEPGFNWKMENGNWKFREATSLQPDQTLVLDLSPSEDDLLAQMKPKTRYNIRLSEKHGVKIKKDLAETIDIFWQLGRETTGRDNFLMHPLDYYQKMWQTLHSQRHILHSYTAVCQGKNLACVLVLFDPEEKTAYYLHGASASEQRELMAPYLCQWQAIKEAKKAGLEKYDFWGVAVSAKSGPLDKSGQLDQLVADANHKWVGITRFKLGFAPNGKIIQYPPAVDLLIKPWLYKIYKLIKKLL